MIPYAAFPFKRLPENKKERNNMNTKQARHTEPMKAFALHIRLDDECRDILRMYCEQKGVSKAEALREGIARLKGTLKNEY